MEVRCNHCGAKNSATQRLCQYCGMALTGTEPPPLAPDEQTSKAFASSSPPAPAEKRDPPVWASLFLAGCVLAIYYAVGLGVWLIAPNVTGLGVYHLVGCLLLARAAQSGADSQKRGSSQFIALFVLAFIPLLGWLVVFWAGKAWARSMEDSSLNTSWRGWSAVGRLAMPALITLCVVALAVVPLLGLVGVPWADGADSGAAVPIEVLVAATPTRRPVGQNTPSGSSGDWVAWAQTASAPTPRSPEWYIEQLQNVRATPTPASDACIPWQKAGQYIGKYKCICGTVHHVQNTGTIGFVHFDSGTESFYVMQYGRTWPETLVGRKARVCGTVENPTGRPRIVIGK